MNDSLTPRAEPQVVVESSHPTSRNYKTLRISNGGNIPLLQHLSEHFAASRNDQPGIKIELQRNTSPSSLILLENGETDIALTFERAQEKVLLDKKSAVCLGDIFDIGFALVGSEGNPADVDALDSSQVSFGKIYKALATGKAKFVSRSDQSVGHLTEMAQWNLAHVDPTMLDADCYLRRNLFPPEALQEADENQAYMLIDLPTWHLTTHSLKNTRIISIMGRATCNALVQPNSEVRQLAEEWYSFVTGPLGKDLIAKFPNPEEPMYLAI